MSLAWWVEQFEWVVHHAARSGRFECDAYDQKALRATFVLPDGEVVADTPGQLWFRGVLKQLADLKAWQDVAASLAAQAARLDRR